MGEDDDDDDDDDDVLVSLKSFKSLDSGDGCRGTTICEKGDV